MVRSFVAVAIALCVARTRYSPVVAFSTIASSPRRARRTERAARWWGASGRDDDDDETRARRTATMDRRGALRVAVFGSLATLVVPCASAATTTTTTTTPSAREGGLVPSDPPPDRAKAVAVVAATSSSSSSPDPRFFVAGGASAAASHGLAVPVDVVKTRAQSDDPAVAGAETESPLAAASRIVENEGWAALTTGWRPTVLGYGVEGALKFGVYETLKSLLSSRGGGAILGDDAGQLSYLAAAVGAGAIASVALCPAEATRIRSVVDGPGERSEKGKEKEVSDDLAASFRRGLAPMLAKQVPYTAGKQVSFDVFAAVLYGAAGRAEFPPRSGTTALAVEVGAAALSSVVACLASQPGDVLLTAAYAADEEEEGFGETVRRVYRDGGGARAFFRGLDARLVHVGCIVTFQLVLYDQLKQALGLPGSGT